VPYATLIPPPSLSFVSIARELLAGTAAPPTSTIRLYGDSYDIEDTPTFIPDNGIRAVLAGLWGETLGPEDATFGFSGPAYMTTGDCYLWDNLFGDLSTVSLGTLGTAQVLAQPISAGDTALYTTTSLGTVVTGSIVQITDGAASEIVIATTGSSGTSVFCANTPCRFAHADTATAALQTAAVSYTHTFAVLNNGTGQPPTHTLTDYSGLTAGTGARYYPSACVSSLELAGDATGLLNFTAAGNSWISIPAAAAPTASSLAIAPLPNWRNTVTVGGTQIYTAGTWNATFTRPLLGYWGANAQAPIYLARGDLAVTGTITYSVPQDESPLLQMTSGTPTTLAITASNGLTGASARSVTLAMAQVQFLTAKLARDGDVLAYTDTFAAITNLTNVGGSGGAGPATLTVINNTPTF
jgi:hypothetical protein